MLKSLIEGISQELPEVSNTIQQILGTIVDLKKDPVSLLEALSQNMSGKVSCTLFDLVLNSSQ